MDKNTRLMRSYLYQREGWPTFTRNAEEFIDLLGQVQHEQGVISGRIQLLGFDLKNEAILETLTLDVIKTSEIEGEKLNSDKVRSYIAYRLGLDGYGIPLSDRSVDGIVDIMLDATVNCDMPLTKERLFSWHSALFPTGKSGIHTISVGKLREDASGPMQVVSGSFEHRKVHFQAPPAADLDKELDVFITWFNEENNLNQLVKSAIAHLWFITLHPFVDGNGRITRALTDMLLARSDGNSQRYYSLSSQINKEKSHYYEILEESQKGKLDITKWIKWFLSCTYNAIKSSDKVLESVFRKHHFWMNHAKTTLNQRQINIISMLFDGFEGKLTVQKWAKIAKCSEDTASRDIQFLINKKILVKSLEQGKKMGYELSDITIERDVFDHLKSIEKSILAYSYITSDNMPSLIKLKEEGFIPGKNFIQSVIQNQVISNEVKLMALTILGANF